MMSAILSTVTLTQMLEQLPPPAPGPLPQPHCSQLRQRGGKSAQPGQQCSSPRGCSSPLQEEQRGPGRTGSQDPAAGTQWPKDSLGSRDAMGGIIYLLLMWFMRCFSYSASFWNSFVQNTLIIWPTLLLCFWASPVQAVHLLGRLGLAFWLYPSFSSQIADAIGVFICVFCLVVFLVVWFFSLPLNH